MILRSRNSISDRLLATGPAHQRQTYLILYGNPDAELPQYPTDLETRGDGFALDIENDFFRASLSRQMGQLERITIKREHGLELFAGGEGHGELPGIDWAHDYVTSGKMQKMRITLWESCPDYEVFRGPLCTIVRRWGFPYSPVHPVFSPARINVDVEYRFYAGLPWFHKIGTMTAVKDVEIEALRDDEWVVTENPHLHLSGPRNGDAALKVEAFAGSGVHSESLRSNYFIIHWIQEGRGTFWLDSGEYTFGPKNFSSLQRHQGFCVRAGRSTRTRLRPQHQPAAVCEYL